MRFFTAAFASLALLATPIFGAPTAPISISKYGGEVNKGSFIVKLKENVSKEAHLEWLYQHAGPDAITHRDWQSDILHGFAGKFSNNVLDLLRANPDVESIEEDGIMSINVIVAQTDAPWGLARISQNGRLADQNPANLNFTYRYDSSAGFGSDIYVIDTGIFIGHLDFGGRALWGATFGPYLSADGNGHGTHVAGTAAGTRFGVAKRANLIAVKVLSDTGSGTVSDIISGMNFVLNSARVSGRPSIASMSLGGGASDALDNAVAGLTSNGVHVVVAAGNSNVDAGNTSPARAPSAITVGATTIADARASFSNFGAVVDLFAPGQDITSTWIRSPTDINRISGTSMATPHVSGLVAYLIGRNGNVSPPVMSNILNSLAVKGILTGIPVGTINALARNDVA
ncbi:hypothetical protein QCA50_010913 [Cerrena zonata]|uniref:Serine protease n=1 Tax=Cerrena zonata TaxID=2478898 RepID=A0AAW0G913_9APHY